MDLNLINFRKLELNADLLIKKNFNVLLGNIFKFFKLVNNKKILLATFYQKSLKLDIENDKMYFKKFYQDKYRFEYEMNGYLYYKNITISLEGVSFFKNKFRDYYGIMLINNIPIKFHSEMLLDDDSFNIKNSTKNLSLFIDLKNNYSKNLFTLYKSSSGFNVIYNNIELLKPFEKNVDYLSIIMICCIFGK